MQQARAQMSVAGAAEGKTASKRRKAGEAIGRQQAGLGTDRRIGAIGAHSRRDEMRRWKKRCRRGAAVRGFVDAASREGWVRRTCAWGLRLRYAGRRERASGWSLRSVGDRRATEQAHGTARALGGDIGRGRGG